MLRKKIVCPYCGRKLSPMWQWNHSKTKRLHYYYCANRECQGIYIPATKIEKQVLIALKNFIRKDTIYQGIITEIDAQMKQLMKKEKRIDQKRSNSRIEIIQQFEEGKITLDEMKRLLNSFEDKQSSQTLTISQYQIQLDRLLELQEHSVQRLILNHVNTVSVQKDKRINGIYLQGISETFISGKRRGCN
nr:zinc ribbon domain-containing protein [Enterococcus hulanensis]